MEVGMNLEAEWAQFFGIRLLLAEARKPLDPLDLTPGEQEIWHTLSKVREPSWLLGRAALHALLPRLGRAKDSSLLKFPEAQVSLTHTSYEALAVGTSEAICGIGIDCEDDKTVKRAALRFFANEAERAAIDDDASALRLWTIKEALYKADADNGQETLISYRLAKPQAAEGEAYSREGRLFRYIARRTERGFTTLALRVS